MNYSKDVKITSIENWINPYIFPGLAEAKGIEIARKDPLFDKLINFVIEEENLMRSTLFMDTRKQRLVTIRACIAETCWRVLKMTEEAIKKEFAIRGLVRNRSSISNSRRVLRQEIENDPILRSRFEKYIAFAKTIKLNDDSNNI